MASAVQPWRVSRRCPQGELVMQPRVAPRHTRTTSTASSCATWAYAQHAPSALAAPHLAPAPAPAQGGSEQLSSLACGALAHRLGPPPWPLELAASTLPPIPPPATLQLRVSLTLTNPNPDPDPDPKPNPSQVRVPTGCRFEMLGTSTEGGRAARGGKRAPPSSQEWAPGKLCIADTSFVHRTRNDHTSESRYVMAYVMSS